MSIPHNSIWYRARIWKESRVFVRRHKEIHKTTVLMSDTIKQLRSRGQLTHSEIWNTCAFLGLANYDLSVLILAMARERDEWTRKILARNVVIVAYETTEDMQELLGKKFRKTLEDLGVLAKFDIPLRSARKPLDDFWKKHQVNLKHLRVNSSAHRNQDTIMLIEMIESIDTAEILKIGLEIGKIQNELGAFLQTVLNETASINPPETASAP